MKAIRLVLISLTVFLSAGCLQEEVIKRTYSGFSPTDIEDGWIISSPEEENMDAASLDDLYRNIFQSDNTWMMKSLVVFRNGHLVAEAYLKDEADRTLPAPIWSCTKQVNSIITGIAVHQGFIANIEDPVEKYLPVYIHRYPEKQDLTLKHLLTMTSGLDFDNSTQSDIFRQHKTKDGLDYVLGLRLTHPPGTFYHYKDGDPQVVSGIIQSATGMPLDEYGRKVLFEPLGITNYAWGRYSDGVTLGAWGILTSPRELAKIGQCVLDSGRFHSRRIIPLDWWKEMLSPKIENAHDDAAFGYFWWSIPDKGWYFMWGHGGQYVFLHPATRLMVVATSLPQVEDDFALWYDQIVHIAEDIKSAAY